MVPVTAGMSALGYRRFMVANTVGAALWVGTVLGLGYVTAASWTVALQVLVLAGPVVLLGGIGAATGRAVARGRRRRSPPVDGVRTGLTRDRQPA
jgi:membrane protein DedA with SNARE-associated domain